MPPEIAVAILDVMGKVKTLEKEAQTTGGSRFKYTSVDQFFELLGPLMASAGIFTLLHEVNATIDQRTTSGDNGGTRTSTWMTTDYEIWIYHKSGVAYGPVTRKIQVIASGPQSYGMGPSYVEKYFLRSLFKIPTGDEDADNHPKTGLPATDRREPPPRQEPERDRSKEKEAAEANVRAYIGSCKTEWLSIKSQADMGAWWRSHIEDFNVRFSGKDDPLYVEFKAAFAEAGNKLPAEAPKVAEKPKDDVPEFKGDARPSESSIRMEFKAALQRTVSYDDCNEAFMQNVEPYEKSLPKPFVDEMYELLKARQKVLEK
jgi:hypothetical protein